MTSIAPLLNRFDAMIDGKKVLGLILARSGSKGLPGKNIKMTAGKPLIVWSIEQARNSDLIDDVVVSTDSQDIADIAIASSARVPFLRPVALAGDTSTSVDAVIHALEWLEGESEVFDIVLLLEPTSPLRETSDIDGALKQLLATRNATSIVSVAAVEAFHPKFLFRENDCGFLEPFTSASPDGIRRQDIEPLLFIEGSVYASYVPTLRTRLGFYHDATIGWCVERYKSLEIDELADHIAVEALLLARQEGRI